MSFDFASVTTPFRMQPGLRRLSPGDGHLTPNRTGDRHLLEKLDVLTNAWPMALVADAAFDAAPALEALCVHAAAAHPQAVRWHAAQQALHAEHLGWSLHGADIIGREDALPAIGAGLEQLPAIWRRPALLSLAFAEDFAIVDGASGRIGWLAVCLPSNWSPEAKVGRHFAEVHAPVPDNRRLLDAGEQLLRLVTSGGSWERFVWTITRHPKLDAHPRRAALAEWPTGAAADEIARQSFFRTERQTFIAVPGRSQAVFTIHVEVSTLAEAADRPAQAEALRSALASMSPAVLAYRGLDAPRDRLLEWLAARAAA